ncbi:hypothetical protein DFH27DRAFT_250737 [Peziza echinospora]|nr:hypothetical protein DFH27DRAFT_250737 [Peziza echinospora]
MASSMFSSNSSTFGHMKPPLLHALSLKRRKTSTAVAAATTLVRAFTSPRGKHVLLRQSLKYRKMFHSGNGLIRERGPGEELYNASEGWVTDGETSDREGGNTSDMDMDGKHEESEHEVEHHERDEHWDIMEETGFSRVVREKDLLLERSLPEVYGSLESAVHEVKVEVEVVAVAPPAPLPVVEVEVEVLPQQEVEVEVLPQQEVEVQSHPEVEVLPQQEVEVQSQPQPLVEAVVLPVVESLPQPQPEIEEVQLLPEAQQTLEVQQPIDEVELQEEIPQLESLVEVQQLALAADEQQVQQVEVHVTVQIEATPESVPNAEPEVIVAELSVPITEVEPTVELVVEPLVEQVLSAVVEAVEVEQAAAEEVAAEEAPVSNVCLLPIEAAVEAAVVAAVADILPAAVAVEEEEATTKTATLAEDAEESMDNATVAVEPQASTPFTDIPVAVTLVQSETLVVAPASEPATAQLETSESLPELVEEVVDSIASSNDPHTEPIQLATIAEKGTIDTAEPVQAASDEPTTVPQLASAEESQSVQAIHTLDIPVEAVADAIPVVETPALTHVNSDKPKEEIQLEKLISLPDATESTEACELQLKDQVLEVSAIDDTPVVQRKADISLKHSEQLAEDRNRSSFLEVLEGRLLATPTRLLKLVLPVSSASPDTMAFLVSPDQPLSDLERLIQAELPREDHNKPAVITFHDSELETDTANDKETESPAEEKSGQAGLVRWSLSTEIGGFVADASKSRSFTMQIAQPQHTLPAMRPTRIKVSVPNFSERTHYLRQQLKTSTSRLNQFSGVKSECDRLAKRSAQRIAFSGFLALIAWWTLVFQLQPWTTIGWEVMELATYLIGLGTVITGYSWFLYHNREVNFSRVPDDFSVTKRQLRLYRERDFDLVAWKEAGEETRRLRREVEQLADDYHVAWDGNCEQDPAAEIHGGELNDDKTMVAGGKAPLSSPPPPYTA